MPAATRSVRPWFTHRRMLPKWAGFLLMGGMAVAFPAERAWLFFLVGLAIFFPSEYVVHRGVFHHFAHKPAGRVLSAQHVRHHEDPEDVDYLFNFPVISVGIGTLFFVGYYAFTRNLGAAAALSFGNFAGLLYYEWVHFAAHRPGSRPRTPWARWVKRTHLLHHYKNEHYWFGVTAPAGALDHAFGTYRKKDGVERSRSVRTLKPPADAVEAMAEEPVSGDAATVRSGSREG